MSSRLNQFIAIALYYFVGLLCFFAFQAQVNPCVKLGNSVSKWKVSENEGSNVVHFLLFVTVFSLNCMFFFSLYILLLIIDILMLVRLRQEDVCLLRVWICAQTIHILIIFAEFLTLMPWCITKLHHIEGPFMISTLNAVFTCFFLVALHVYKQHLKVQQQLCIEEVSWYTFPTEVQQEVINEHQNH
jgi:hypothetical protein